MDPLRADDIQRARGVTPTERLLQALELMDVGFTLQRQNLRRRFPDTTDGELEAHMQRWLVGDDAEP